MAKRKKRPALDLFGEVPCTWSDVAAWCVAVAGIAPGSPRFVSYARGWNVPDKVRAAKLAGTYLDTLRAGLTQGNRFTLDALIFLAHAEALALQAIDASVRVVDIPTQIAQFHPNAAPSHQAARQARQERLHQVHGGLPALRDGNRPRAKQRSQTIGQQVILRRKEKLAHLRESRNARVRAGFTESITQPSHDVILLENRTKKTPRRAGKTCIPGAPLTDRTIALALAGRGDADAIAYPDDHAVNRTQDTAHSRSPDRLSRAGETAPAHDEHDQPQAHQARRRRIKPKKIRVHVAYSITPLGNVRV